LILKKIIFRSETGYSHLSASDSSGTKNLSLLANGLADHNRYGGEVQNHNRAAGVGFGLALQSDGWNTGSRFLQNC
jgi:hypothetical protein